MRMLCICPGVSRAYMAHVRSIARRGWDHAAFLERDVKRHGRHVKRVFYGLGLLTLVSSLPQGTDVVFVDENLEKGPLETIYREDYDLVALTGQVIQAERTLELAARFVERNIPVVVGGVHASVFPEDYEALGVSVVCGEGEGLFQEYLADLERGETRSVYRKDPKDCVDLSTIPDPVFSHVSGNRYSLMGVQTTRGCPYRCRYCNVSAMLGDRYRHRPVERVRQEVVEVKRRWPDAMFYFFDDNLFADTEYALELFESLADLDLGIWGTHADVSIAENKELLRLLTRNGRPFLAIGFETLSETNAKALGNPVKAGAVNDLGRRVDKLRNAGIDVGGSFMFGFPGDTARELERIVSFVQEHGIRGYITRYSAIPGSAMYEDLVREIEDVRGPIPVHGTERARLVNEYLGETVSDQRTDSEGMIVDALKAAYAKELPLSQIDALAVYRCFFESPGHG